ncbi:MAG: mechanosensitive ion channel family protein [Amoebophilaceae bacterium]|nr:mechanosensitive ion channel family protein [Amoebophilaceae bacterium]
MSVLLLPTVLCLFSAQTREALFDYNLSSPYDTVVTHLGFLKKGNYHPEIAAEAFCQKYRNQQEAIALAIQLQQLLQDNRVDINLSQVPKDVHYIDPEAQYHKYQLTEVFPEIYLVKVNNQWIYSEETAQNITVLSQKNLYPLGSKKLYQLLPHEFGKSFLGLYLWQYVLLLLLILLVASVYRSMIFFSRKWLYPYSSRCDSCHILLMQKLMGLFGSLFVLMLFLPTVQLPATVEQVSIRLLKGTLTPAIMAVCYQWLNVLIPHTDQRHVKTVGRLNGQLMLLAKPFLRVLIVLTGILLTLKVLKFDISRMLAGISIGGIGVALASQDTIKNFFGTLTIFIDQPFVLGDTIVTDNIKGTVEEIGLRATRLRTHHQSIIYVPNAKLIDTHIDNHGLRNRLHVDVGIAIAYNTPSTLIEAFLEKLRKIAERHDYLQQEGKHAICLESIQNGILKILFRVHFFVTHPSKELQYRSEVLSDITKLAEELGVHLVSLSS